FLPRARRHESVLFGYNRCHRCSADVSSAAGVSTEAPGASLWERSGKGNRSMIRFLRLPTIGQVTAWLSLFGLVGLGYLCGATVMFFRLPTSDFINKSLTGAKAWRERGRPDISRLPLVADRGVEKVRVDKADKTYDGFTLYTTTEGTRATLIDMRGETVH